MSYPPGITLRPVTIGGATTLESGEQLSLVAEIKSSRSLMWGATGWQFHAVTRTIKGNDGEELTFSLPVTDLPGWRLLDNPGSAIDVSTPGSYTHTYTVKLATLQGGRPVAVRTVGPFVLPAEDLSPVDLDLMLPVGTQAGGVVLVPDTWDARVAAAEAAAADMADAAGIIKDALTGEDEAVAYLLDAESATRASAQRIVEHKAHLDALVNRHIPTDAERLHLVTNWAPGHGWTLGPAGVILDEVTPWGTTALRIAPEAPETLYQPSVVLTPAVDMTGKRMVVWVRVFDMHALTFLRVTLASPGGNTVRFRLPFDANNVSGESRNGWIPYEFSPANLDSSTGTIDWAAINNIRIEVYRAAGNTAPVDVAAIALRTPSPKWPNGVVTFSFDDWHLTDYTVAKPKLDQYGWKGSAFICPERIEDEGATSLAYAHEMQDAGWDMCAHSFNLASHVNWRLWTEGQLMFEWERLKRKMIDLGLTSGIDHLATPEGANSPTITHLAQQGWWASVRLTGAVHSPQLPVPMDKYRVGAYSFTTLSAAQLTTVKDRMDDARANGGHFILNAHDLTDPTTRANWEAAVDYASSIGVAVAPYVQVVTGR